MTGVNYYVDPDFKGTICDGIFHIIPKIPLKNFENGYAMDLASFIISGSDLAESKLMKLFCIPVPG